MEDKTKNEDLSPLVIISKDRQRTNILKKYEQQFIAFLVQRVPSWISSDMLTGIGFAGNIIIFLSFILAYYISPVYLLIGVFGFFVSWFGDSLDGRIAYYRRIPRKWYGFTLDITTDWVGIILIGCGFIVYAKNPWELFGFGFVVLYGWEMLTALLRYKITNEYSIDSGKLGPTEVRIIISLILILEVLVNGSIHYSTALACIILLITNIIDTIKLLKLGDIRDKKEKEAAKNL
ncbi:MAG: CDP-alcohol phosphatidyltransferase family protein [Paludibacter sp.]